MKQKEKHKINRVKNNQGEILTKIIQNRTEVYKPKLLQSEKR